MSQSLNCTRMVFVLHIWFFYTYSKFCFWGLSCVLYLNTYGMRPQFKLIDLPLLTIVVASLGFELHVVTMCVALSTTYDSYISFYVFIVWKKINRDSHAILKEIFCCILCTFICTYIFESMCGKIFLRTFSKSRLFSMEYLDIIKFRQLIYAVIYFFFWFCAHL